MSKIVWMIIFLWGQIYAKDLQPVKIFESQGSVTDFIYENGLLYATTDLGVIDIIDVNSSFSVDRIVFPEIKDFMGDVIDTKLYSIDKRGDRLLIVAQGIGGFKDLYIYSAQNNLTKIIESKKDKIFMKNAFFIDDNRILISELGNSIILYDIKSAKKIYEVQVSMSRFSDMRLSEDKSHVFTTDESGIVYMLDVDTGEIKKEYKGENVDNCYQLDVKNGMIITAGQDRRSAIYDMKADKSYYMKADFLVYSAALSEDAKLGAFASTIDNGISVFDTKTKKVKYKLLGQNSTLTKIFFINNKEMITSSEDSKILYWFLE